MSAVSAAGPEQAAARETCELFRQMVVGINSLSTREQQDLVNRMTDAVQGSGDAELMYAVFDLGNGYLESNPKQFAYGMRKLSAMCNVPYQ